jgi:hypothetical protein
MRQLLLGGVDILEQFNALQQGVVIADIDQHGRAPPVLGEHHRAARSLDPPHHGGKVRAEVGQRLDILGQTRTCHGSLADYVQNSVHNIVRGRKSGVAA